MTTTASEPNPTTAQLRNRLPESAPRASRLVIKVAGIVAVFLGLAGAGYWWGTRQEPLAELVRFEGPTERDEATAIAKWYAAKSGDDFHVGDGARTAAQAEAHFELAGGARLKLKPASIVRFHRRKPGGPIKVDVEMGEVDVQSGSGALTIDSEFGALELDANSSVNLTRQGASLLVDVELGGLQMNQRVVGAGNKLTLELGGIVVDLPPQPTAAPEPAPTAAAPTEPEPPRVDPGDGVAYADLVTAAGASIVIHDPNPPTAVGISTASVCKGPARLKSGEQSTEGVGQLNLKFTSGQHGYEVSCLDAPERPVAKGRISVLRDSGTQRLPTFAPTANIVTDGRVYTVMYQHKLPTVSVSWPTAPQAASYTLSTGNRTITTKTPNYTLRSLSAGRHKVTFSAATSPVRTSRTTTVEIQHDAQAPTGEVAQPAVDFAPSASVEVSGNTLPGWTVSVGGKELRVDGQRTFSTQASGTQTIPIVFTHPTYGTHYYLRRPKAAP